jgi:hypothetical protein
MRRAGVSPFNGTPMGDDLASQCRAGDAMPWLPVHGLTRQAGRYRQIALSVGRT